MCRQLTSESADAKSNIPVRASGWLVTLARARAPCDVVKGLVMGGSVWEDALLRIPGILFCGSLTEEEEN